jgi:hypothetical protein
MTADVSLTVRSSLSESIYRCTSYEWAEIRQTLFAKNFRKKCGKVLTKKNAAAFLETFPLKRKWFFEIYFVRLIGTPNQHIPRHRIHLLCRRSDVSHFSLVVHESLGFMTL